MSKYSRLISYFFTVIAPTIVVGVYMGVYAADQYHSRVAFSVRSLETSPASNVLGMLTQVAGPGAEDALVLYDFLQSQRIVELLEQREPLEAIYNVPQADPVFRLGEDQSIEDKTEYWNFFTTVTFDNASRIIEVETRAFTPEDARRVALAIAEESENLVNELSERARSDAVRFAKSNVSEAEERLRNMRVQLSQFRNATQEIDPTANAQLQLQLVASLEQQLAESETQLQGLRSYLGTGSPPVRVLARRIESLEQQIKRERDKLAGNRENEQEGQEPLSQRLAVFEELTVDLEFASNLYTAALTALSQAEADARRSQRYLATHIEPTLSQEAIYPERELITLSTFIGLTLLWAIARLVMLSVSART